MAENAWNLRDPSKVKMAYTADTKWRNRSQFVNGRDEVEKFLSGKWDKELEYRLIKEYWAHTDDRIAVRFVYEYCNSEGVPCFLQPHCWDASLNYISNLETSVDMRLNHAFHYTTWCRTYC